MSKKNTIHTHYKEEDDDDESNMNLKIVDIDDIDKQSDSSYSNRADIDEFDSPGLNPKNEIECCLT